MLLAVSSWVQAFSVFFMYRSGVNSPLALPMEKYGDYITQLADPKRHYTLKQWINYDRQFRLTMDRNHRNLTLWSKTNKNAFTKYLSQPLGLAAASALTASGAD